MTHVSKLDLMKRAQTVDEYGAVQQEVAAFKPKLARLKSLSQEISSWYDSFPADASCEAVGIRFIVLVSPREEERKVDAVKLYRAVGKDTFMEVVKPQLGLIDKHVQLDRHHKFLTKSQTGPRRLSPILSNVVPITSKKVAA